ncbi:MAG: ATP-binding protein [Anaerolineae bacterium]
MLRLDPENERLLPTLDTPAPDLLRTPISMQDIPNLTEWFDGKVRPLQVTNVTAAAPRALLDTLGSQTVCVIPLVISSSMQMVGAIILGSSDLHLAELLNAVAPIAALALRNAITHTRVVDQLAAKTQELSLTRRVDRELNDTMKQSHVFEITLDWAMRVTLADSASLALYDQNTDELRYAIDLGYETPGDKIALLRQAIGSGIAHRVARSGHTEVIPDVSVDQDYVEISTHMKSHISVPVMREDRVIAIITIESRRLNHFTDDHVDFVEKLATRAGVAIDNARLYAEAVREREKYSLILGATSDVVMAIGHDDRIIQINPAAIASFRLYTDHDYVGEMFTTAIDHSAIQAAFKRVKTFHERAIEEILLPDGKTYHANFAPHEQIGWIVVMHDISEFKQMDQLKSELVATVSHDLRQPLMVMNGYVDLLTMHTTLDERSERYLKMLARSIQTMRRLIEDLLDLAKIESGMQLQIEPTKISDVIEECTENARPAADAKQMTLTIDVSSSLPLIAGDHARLVQIFNNLIMNAIKYTPPEGKVHVWAEQRGAMIRIAVQDTGVGISPQDQARIFDRFYRVRNAENESIEGTGLGLAIVKRLIEAHHGQIGLESLIGHGSTFSVTLPIADHQPPAASAPSAETAAAVTDTQTTETLETPAVSTAVLPPTPSSDTLTGDVPKKNPGDHPTAGAS